MSYTLYGIKNCNSVKKAVDWLNQHTIPFQFHDYKKSGITQDMLQQWCKAKGWDHIINKNGTTFKALDTSIKDTITNEKAAINLMMEKNSCIKRPIITDADGNICSIRFDEAIFESVYLK